MRNTRSWFLSSSDSSFERAQSSSRHCGMSSSDGGSSTPPARPTRLLTKRGALPPDRPAMVEEHRQMTGCGESGQGPHPPAVKKTCKPNPCTRSASMWTVLWPHRYVVCLPVRTDQEAAQRTTIRRAPPAQSRATSQLGGVEWSSHASRPPSRSLENALPRQPAHCRSRQCHAGAATRACDLGPVAARSVCAPVRR